MSLGCVQRGGDTRTSVITARRRYMNFAKHLPPVCIGMLLMAAVNAVGAEIPKLDEIAFRQLSAEERVNVALSIMEWRDFELKNFSYDGIMEVLARFGAKSEVRETLKVSILRDRDSFLVESTGQNQTGSEA